MSSYRLTLTVVLAWHVGLLGCALHLGDPYENAPRGNRTAKQDEPASQDTRRAGSVAEGKAEQPGAAAQGADPLAQSSQRAGSSLGPPNESAAGDAKALADTLAQLQASGAIDPAQQARLMDDLRQTDPALWPLMIEAFRASMAFRDRETARLANKSSAVPPAAQLTDTTPRSSVPPPSHSQRGDDRPRTETAAAADVAMSAAKSEPEKAKSDAIVAPTSPVVQASNQSNADAAAPQVVQAAHRETVADKPAGDSKPRDFGGHLSAAIEALEEKTKDPAAGPSEASAHAYLRMLYLVAGRREDALRPIVGLNETEQDYWSKQIWALATHLDADRLPDAKRRAAEAAQHLHDAAGKLSELGSLVVRNLAFCTEVRSYGVFTRFPTSEFKAGQRVLLYAEVENFKTDHTPKGYRTALKTSYQILDAQGRRVAGEDSAVVEELCQNPRRDYFISYDKLYLPDNIYEGAYTLQLTIEDTLGQKVGQGTIEFSVKAK